MKYKEFFLNAFTHTAVFIFVLFLVFIFKLSKLQNLLGTVERNARQFRHTMPFKLEVKAGKIALNFSADYASVLFRHGCLRVFIALINLIFSSF